MGFSEADRASVVPINLSQAKQAGFETSPAYCAYLEVTGGSPLLFLAQSLTQVPLLLAGLGQAPVGKA
jgi:hypothetical protein